MIINLVYFISFYVIKNTLLSCYSVIQKVQKATRRKVELKRIGLTLIKRNGSMYGETDPIGEHPREVRLIYRHSSGRNLIKLTHPLSRALSVSLIPDVNREPKLNGDRTSQRMNLLLCNSSFSLTRLQNKLRNNVITLDVTCSNFTGSSLFFFFRTQRPTPRSNYFAKDVSR